MQIAIIGVPFNGDGTPPEEENPAKALRASGLADLLQAKGHRVVDHGDLCLPRADGRRDLASGILNLKAWQRVTADLSQALLARLAEEAFLLVLGGDCGILVGVAAAFALRQKPLQVLFVDGHADFHAPEDSPEGELADMELAVLTGYGPQALTAPYGKSPLLDPANVLVCGIRAHEGIARAPVMVLDRRRLAQEGIQGPLTETLRSWLRQDMPLWVHFDVDVIDPGLMPVIFPERDGLSADEAVAVLRTALATGRVTGMSVTCYHPNLDADGQAGRLAADILAASFQALK